MDKKNYREITIERLCDLINYLDDSGCLLEEDLQRYFSIMGDYKRFQANDDLINFGEHEHEGHHSYIAYSILDVNNIREMEYIYYDDTPEAANSLLYDVAKMICFSDCSDEIVEAIIVQGYKLEYIGWQPGMLYEFRDQKSGKIVWSARFPEWDH